MQDLSEPLHRLLPEQWSGRRGIEDNIHGSKSCAQLLKLRITEHNIFQPA